jgi:hypothetical protein
VLPKLTGNFDRVDTGLGPPGLLVAYAVYGAVMRTAERHDIFIARFSAERAWLHKSDMMGIRGLAAAQKAGLLDDETKMVFVAIAPWRRHREYALIDAWGRTGIGLIAPTELPGSSFFRRIGGQSIRAFGC